MENNPTTSAPMLGRLVQVYKLSGASSSQLLLIMLFSAAISALFLLPAAFDTTSTAFIERTCLSLWGVFCLLPVGFGVRKLYRLHGLSLSLYEDGLVYHVGGKDFSTTWDDIDSYIEETACLITRKDGQVIEFGLDIEGATEVTEKIREETLKRLLPRAESAVRAGMSVEFEGTRLPGKSLSNLAYASSGFRVDASGITALDERNHILWRDVTDYGITQAKMGRVPVDLFFIRDASTTLRTRLGLLKNAHVLLTLCADMIKQKQSDSTRQPYRTE